MFIGDKSVPPVVSIELPMLVAAIVTALNGYAFAPRNMKAAISATYHGLGTICPPPSMWIGIKALSAQPPIDGNAQQQK
jgi:hypothetical protein